MKTSRRLALVVVGLSLGAAGCGQDAEVLARVGRKVMGKVEAAGQDAVCRISPRWEAARAGCPNPTLAARVACRLRWDQGMAGADIHVQATANMIELTGAVADLDQRHRAVELAQSTVGVEQVIDALTLPEPSVVKGSSEE